MTRRCLVVEDEVMIRDLIGDVAALEGWAVRSCETLDDARQRLDPPPEILFLDISLRHADALDILDLLSERRFAGAVQIISGHSLTTIHQVRDIGRAKGLTMMEPILKPFLSADIVQALRQCAQDHPPRSQAMILPPPVNLSWQAWIDPKTGKAVCMDGELSAPDADDLTSAVQAQAGGGSAPPDCPWTIAVPTTVGEAEAYLANNRPGTAGRLTFVFTEEDAFQDIERARGLFAKLGIRGIRVRLDRCGPRTFAVAGHRPLHIDEIVMRGFLRGSLVGGAGERKLKAVAALAHRSGARLMAAEIGPGYPLDLLAGAGFDLVQMSGRALATIDAPAGHASAAVPWKRVSFADIASMRQTA